MEHVEKERRSSSGTADQAGRATMIAGGGAGALGCVKEAMTLTCTKRTMRAVQQQVEAAQIVHQVEVVAPLHKPSSSRTLAARAPSCRLFLARRVPLQALLSPAFRAQEGVGAVLGVLRGARVDRGNVACLIGGVLQLVVDEGTYRSLGLKGRRIAVAAAGSGSARKAGRRRGGGGKGGMSGKLQKAAKESGSRWRIDIDLQHGSFCAGDAQFDRTLWCLHSDRVAPCDWLFACPSSADPPSIPDVPMTEMRVPHTTATYRCRSPPNLAALAATMRAPVAADKAGRQAAMQYAKDVIQTAATWLGAVACRLPSVVWGASHDESKGDDSGSASDSEDESGDTDHDDDGPRIAASRGLLLQPDLLDADTPVMADASALFSSRTTGLLSSTQVMDTVRAAQAAVQAHPTLPWIAVLVWPLADVPSASNASVATHFAVVVDRRRGVALLNLGSGYAA